MKKTNSFPTYVHQESNRYFAMQEEFEDNKRVIRIRNSKKNRQHNGQKEKEQTTQWPKRKRTDNTMAKKKKNRQHNGQKEKGQKDKQRSTKHIHKTKDRVTRTPLKTRDELRCSGRVSSSCPTSGTRRVDLSSIYIRFFLYSWLTRCCTVTHLPSCLYIL